MNKTTKDYEDQILKSLDKVSFEMKKIKFILFIVSYFNKLKKNKSMIIQIAIIIYSILITILFLNK